MPRWLATAKSPCGDNLNSSCVSIFCELVFRTGVKDKTRSGRKDSMVQPAISSKGQGEKNSPCFK